MRNNILQCTLMCALVAAPTVVSAQQPAWAEGKTFKLEQVSITARFPSGALSNAPGYHIIVHGNQTLDVRRFDDHGETVMANGEALKREVIYDLLDRLLQAQFFELPTNYAGGAKTVPAPFNPLAPPPDSFTIRRDHSTLDSGYIDLTLTIAQHRKTVRFLPDECPKVLTEIADRIRNLARLPRASSDNGGAP
jgi:hypothetical protein